MDRRSSRYSREDRVYARCTLERRPCLNDNQWSGIDGGVVCRRCWERVLDRLIVNMISSSQKNREIVLVRGKEFGKSINHVIKWFIIVSIRGTMGHLFYLYIYIFLSNFFISLKIRIRKFTKFKLKSYLFWKI